jgi:hypothetical protein
VSKSKEVSGKEKKKKKKCGCGRSSRIRSRLYRLYCCWLEEVAVYSLIAQHNNKTTTTAIHLLVFSNCVITPAVTLIGGGLW